MPEIKISKELDNTFGATWHQDSVYIHGTPENVILDQISRYEPTSRHHLEELVVFLDDLLSNRYTAKQKMEIWLSVQNDVHMNYPALIHYMTLWRDLGKAKLAEFDAADTRKTQ